MTRNLTLAIDDDLLDKVRVLAAIKRTSVNEMVRGFLTRLVEQESEHDEATEALLKLARESKGRLGDWRPGSRDEIYSGEPRFDREY
jgi:plasmid stability protein